MSNEAQKLIEAKNRMEEAERNLVAFLRPPRVIEDPVTSRLLDKFIKEVVVVSFGEQDAAWERYGLQDRMDGLCPFIPKDVLPHYVAWRDACQKYYEVRGDEDEAAD